MDDASCVYSVNLHLFPYIALLIKVNGQKKVEIPIGNHSYFGFGSVFPDHICTSFHYDEFKG